MSHESDDDLSPDAYQAIAQWVFTNTMIDLKGRLTDSSLVGDRYQMLGLAPLLRKLLIDGGNLVSRVNRKYRLPLEFRIAPFSLSERECYAIISANHPHPEIPINEMKWRLFSPGTLVPNDEDSGQSLTLAHFLRAHVGVVCGHLLTVKELVQFYCIVEGGVHIGDARNRVEKDLIGFVPNELSMPNSGVDNSPLASLFVCGEIVLSALAPLEDAIAKDPTPLNPNPDFFAMTTGAPRHWKGGVARN